MTQRSRTGFAVRCLAGLTAVAGLMCAGSLCEVTPAFAAKPALVPPGKIYHKFHPSYIGSMNGDGSGLVEELPAAAMNALTPMYSPYVIPSHQLYGGSTKPNSGSRWFISLATTGYYDRVITSTGSTLTDYPHNDLVAVRRRPGSTTEIDVIQLTDFYGIINVFPQSGCLSNDSNENLATSFVGAWGIDIRDAMDSPTSYDSRLTQNYTLRLPLTVSEFLDAGFQPFDDTLTDLEIDDLLWPLIKGAVNKQAATSPTGDLAVATYQSRLMIVNAAAPDYSNPVRLLWDGSVTSPVSPYFPQWSPNGLTIAFEADGSSNIWTVPVAGGNPKKILAGTATSKYTRPIWSPDSQYVLAVRDDYSGTTVIAKFLVRVPAAGGTPVTVREIGFTGGPALRWVP